MIVFSPKQDIMDEIRAVSEKHMKKSHFEVMFLDVIQTGRKMWVEIYIGSESDLISVKELNEVRHQIKKELKTKFDQVYVELIPDIESLKEDNRKIV